MVTTRHVEIGKSMISNNEQCMANYPLQSWPNTEGDGKSGGHGVAYKRDSTNRIVIYTMFCYGIIYVDYSPALHKE